MNTSDLPNQNSQLNIYHEPVNSSTASSTMGLSSYISAKQSQQHQQMPASMYSESRHLQITTNGVEKDYLANTPFSARETNIHFNNAAGHATNPPNVSPANSIASDCSHPSTIPLAKEKHGLTNSDAQTPTITSINDTFTSSSFTFNSFHTISKDSTLSAEIDQATHNENHQQATYSKLLTLPSFPKSISEDKVPQRLEVLADVCVKQSQNITINSGIVQPDKNYGTATSVTKNSSKTYEYNNLLFNKNSNQNVSTSMESSPGIDVNNIKTDADSPYILHEMSICLKNPYTDTNNISEMVSMQQSSQITPATQHKPIVDTTSPLMNEDSFESNILVIDEPDSTTTATAPHTPPTTPENAVSLHNTLASNSCHSNTNISTTVLSNEMPSTSMGKATETLKSPSRSTNFIDYKNIPCELSSSKQDKDNSPLDNVCNSNNNSIYSSTNISCSESLPCKRPQTPLTAFTPTQPPTQTPSPKGQQAIGSIKQENSWINQQKLSVGEDVLIKRTDNRFYLGTIVEHMFRQYHVRFDDGTDIWCRPDEMRKLSLSSRSTGSNSKADNRQVQPMCITCKQSESDSQVEVCERCGRGYHRKCTIETSPGSGQWMCKRCFKPLKILQNHKNSNQEKIMCLDLPYNYNLLKWDKKHRVNEEQIYCYCGKRGKFDSNMIQCCRCLNWYHTGCTHSFAADSKLLRGDAFFVFSCSVCNKGPEFIRRLLMNWTDLVHLVLYNLSLSRRRQQKFHSIDRDIFPFILENRHILSLPTEWIRLPEEKFKDNIYMTLSKNRDQFISNLESKTDNYCFRLRKVVPPKIPKIPVKSSDVLNNDFLSLTLKLQVATNFDQMLTSKKKRKGEHFKEENFSIKSNESKTKSSDKLKTIFNNVHSNVHSSYIESDSSDDELPIKLIKEKVKKKLNELGSLDDNAIDPVHVDIKGVPSSQFGSDLHQIEDNNNLVKKSDTTSTQLLEEKSSSETFTSNDDSHAQHQIHSKNNDKNLLLLTKASSRKRKDFTLGKIYNNHRRIETSSDENSSSSSRGTSLDLIIPPPKNFLGKNNPFRIVSPKKKDQEMHSTSNASNVDGNKKNGYGVNGSKMIKTSVFNTTAFDCVKKLSILKSAGIFPNLNTNHLVKSAGQHRTLRTIKRKLSAKDITIGPNQEVRRRRIRRPSSNIEVISTTTINTIPTNCIPIHAKDLLAAVAAATSNASVANLFNIGKKSKNTCPNISSDSDKLAYQMKSDNAASHGRRLRQRPQKISSDTSRSSSMSSTSSTSVLTSFSAVVAGADCDTNAANQSGVNCEDLKETVNKYFGAYNRIESGDEFNIRAKRLLPNGEMQYLIEWNDTTTTTTSINSVHPINPTSTATNVAIKY